MTGTECFGLSSSKGLTFCQNLWPSSSAEASKPVKVRLSWTVPAIAPVVLAAIAVTRNAVATTKRFLMVSSQGPAGLDRRA